jgi:serine/threonine-protein kinase HipA
VSQHALSINGKRKNITRTDFLSFARLMNIKKAENIIDEVNRKVNSWNNYAEETGVHPKLRHAIDKTLIRL